MDHWGDPWSDNANDVPVTKTEVTSPLPSAPASAPGLLSGFLDDAGWGNEDASLGDWATPPGPAIPVVTTSSPSTLADDTATSGDPSISNDGAQWSVQEPSESLLSREHHNWRQAHQDEAGIASVPSEASDSATTIQPDEHPDDSTAESSGHLQLDDDSSARPSTSPSERSHNEPPADSPRTSIEEDRGAAKPLHLELDMANQRTVEAKQIIKGEEAGLVGEATHKGAPKPITEVDTNNLLQRNVLSGSDNDSYSVASSAPNESEQHTSSNDQSLAKASAPVSRRPDRDASSMVTSLLEELFPPLVGMEEQDDAPDDPIYSTTGRKAWYRLTRRQTLREFQSGSADDNYIRVTWTNSEIRKEVNKTVARWAREDRLSGTGPGARASFYWDTAAPPEPKPTLGHSRTKTSVPTSRAAIPARQSLPPLASHAPAAFNWSSATAVDPWKLDSPDLRSTFSPLAAKSTISENFERSENRDVLRGIASPDLGTLEKVSRASSETLGVASPIAPPIALPAISEQRNYSNSIDKNTETKEDTVAVPAFDDDDDWGEMVGSPKFAEPEISRSIAQSTPPNDCFPTLSATPPRSRSFSTQKQSTEAMHASHITRLKGTISPTSAIFGARSFVPLGVEHGPIGPGMLKPFKRPEAPPLDQHAEKALSAAFPGHIVVQGSPVRHTKSANVPDQGIVTSVQLLEPTFVAAPEDEFLVSAPSTPAPPAAEYDTLQGSDISKQPAQDVWADANFSIFESAPPPLLTSRPKPPVPDEFSRSGTPTRSARSSSAASSKGYGRSPPRNSPPPIQPLTSATNTAQRRKDAEERTIRDILGGLPDLGYML
ncbi:hypothetical protein T440DRAFT_473009, partial [Plenodomus tracheiphilus IPT5]